MKDRIGHKYPAFDFDAPAWRQESRELVGALIKEWEAASSTSAPASSSSSSQQKEKEKRPASAASSSGGKAQQDEESAEGKKKKKKTKEGASSGLSTTSSAASVSSASGSPSASTAPASATTGTTDDPVYKRLVKLAQAMRLMPAILVGIKDMDPGLRSDELRKRLKAKGAVFNLTPSLDDIKKAEAESQLKKDLEGIDTSNIVEGGRRRGGGAAVTVPAPVASPAGKEGKKAGADSGSEDEMEL